MSVAAMSAMTAAPAVTPPTIPIVSAISRTVLPIIAPAISAIKPPARAAFGKIRRRRIRWRRVAITATLAAMFNAQHAPRARIGIEPDHAAFRRHPLQPVMRIAAFIRERTIRIVKRTGMMAADLRQDLIERLHIRRAARLRHSRRHADRQHCQKRQKQQPKHGFF
jgi:hypothetical protein